MDYCRDGQHGSRTRGSGPAEAARGSRFHVGLLSAVVAVGAFAQDVRAGDEADEIPFSVSNVFFELNNTDGDLGIHSLIDGEPWKRLKMIDPKERVILDIELKGRLRKHGLTELFFESAEPPFDELDPEDFFRRFPEGEYEIEGLTLDGVEMEGTAEVTHVMPAQPPNLTVSGIPAAEDCDLELPTVGKPIVIDWDPVTESHPDLGRMAPIEIVAYQVVVQREEPTPLKYTIDLAPNVTRQRIPGDLLRSGDEIKYEVLVREASGNQTATESCFEVE